MLGLAADGGNFEEAKIELSVQNVPRKEDKQLVVVKEAVASDQLDLKP
jgi:hypothetical protein